MAKHDSLILNGLGRRLHWTLKERSCALAMKPLFERCLGDKQQYR